MGQRTNILLQIEGRSGARLNRVYHLHWGYTNICLWPFSTSFPVNTSDEARWTFLNSLPLSSS
jgi:hypothetical protein